VARVRISTTVDEEMLAEARRIYDGSTDAVMIDAALRALLADRRRAEIDAGYEKGYREHPIDEPDEWGDLASWLDASAKAKIDERRRAQAG
jgi:hypothetical protein